MKMTSGNKRIGTALVAMALAMTACGSDSEPQKPGSPVGGDPVTEAPSTVVYQVNPRFYGDGDCLKRVTADIPRIAGMGCDILWLMPIHEIGVDRSVGSPYCVKDHKSVDSHLGTLADFKLLVAEAHANGMSVIMDWVANHTAFDHVWTLSNPERYKKNPDGSISATPMWGDVAQLDYSSDSTREGMIDAMRYWIENAGIDGFRCDYAEGVPHPFWTLAISSLKEVNPDLIMLAESGLTDFYADGFDAVYDWNFAPAMQKVYAGSPVSTLTSYIAESNGKIPEGKSMLRYAFNHDVAAEHDVATLYGSPQGTIGAFVVAAMSGGTPMIYSSMDAEGLSGKLSFFGHRDIDFSDKLTKAYGEIIDAYRKSATARSGHLRTYPSDQAIIMSRSAEGHTLLTVVNPSGETRKVKTPISIAGNVMTDLIGGGETKLSTEMEIPPYGYRIFMD